MAETKSQIPEPADAEQTSLGQASETRQPAQQGTDSTQNEVEQIKSERDVLLDRVARVQAEFENVRKRNARAQQEFKEFALEDALKSLLPILDSFDRALQAPTGNLQEFRSGVELIRKQLHDALSKLGLRRIPSRGEPFDPHLHEAVEMSENAVGDEAHVEEELQRGYKLRDRLLRPAMVRVGQRQKKAN